MVENYVNKSKIQEFARSYNLRISPETIIIINGRVEEMLKEAAKRAQDNNRKTIMPYDL